MTKSPALQSLVVDTKLARIKKLRSTVYNACMHFSGLPGPRSRTWMVTLTYAPGQSWEPQHIRDYLKRLRVWLHRRNLPLRYVWVAELQKRGVVHYHILIWLPLFHEKKRFRIPHSDTRGWWPYGSSNTIIAKKAGGYLMKYVSKCDGDQVFPKGARIYGAGGLDKLGKQRIRWFKAPKYVRAEFATFESADLRKIKDGYVDRFTGLFLRSPWRLVRRSGTRLLFIRCDDPAGLKRSPELLDILADFLENSQ